MFLLLLGLASPVFAECRLPSISETLPAGDSKVLQRWDFADDAVLAAPVAPLPAALAEYRESVAAKVDTNAVALLNAYTNVGANAADAANLAVVRADPTHFLRPIHCLEALLLDIQIRRTPAMLTAPTEFLAYFMRHQDGRLRAYFLTDDDVGIRRMKSLLEMVTTDEGQGWRVIGNLHNPSFFLKNLDHPDASHPQGVLSPSANDMQVFDGQTDLPMATITNGFDSIVIPRDDFARFRTL